MLHTTFDVGRPAPPPHNSRLLRRAERAHGEGDTAKAERLYNTVLQYEPENFDALHGLGKLHTQRGRLDTALILFQTALKIDDNRAEGFADLGLVFHLLRRFDHALTSYEAGLYIAPDDAELLSRRGVALLELRRPQEALECFENALAADPDHLDALGNYGNALLKLNRPAEAIAAYDRALAIVPDNAQLLTNHAAALRRLDRPHDASISVGRALRAKPDFAQARFIESLLRLALGDFSGWRGYEARWSVGFLASQRRNFTAPLWLGAETPDVSLEGKTVLLHAEQGFGDTIQFVRYAKLVAQRGVKKIILEVQRELVSLLSGVQSVDEVIARGSALPAFDCHCPLLSLPLACATDLTTIPAEIPYIVSPAGLSPAGSRSRHDRTMQQRTRIGLVWSGAPIHDNDLNRSLPLAALSPLFELPNISFVSLQHVVRDQDAKILRDQPNIRHIGHDFRDFADTAAAIAGLDAVISADTAVAHLAGAMGKRLFLLLPYAADFRWLRERQDSPWYPTARLYRQPQFGDWDGAIAALKQDLARPDFLASPLRLSA
jgi:tetratricopeptide (TPR) repeat protein